MKVVLNLAGILLELGILYLISWKRREVFGKMLVKAVKEVGSVKMDNKGSSTNVIEAVAEGAVTGMQMRCLSELPLWPWWRLLISC